MEEDPCEEHGRDGKKRQEGLLVAAEYKKMEVASTAQGYLEVNF